MDEIKKLSALDDAQTDQAISIFVEGFYHFFSNVMKDKEKLHMLFKHSFDTGMTYAYLKDGEAIGFAAIRIDNKHPVQLNKDVFYKIISGLKGKLMYKAVDAGLKKVTPANPDEIYIDFIATHPDCRGKGTGSTFITHIQEIFNDKQVMLEVFSSNPRAKKLYERIGFETVQVKKSILVSLQGLGKIEVMRLVR